MIQITKKNLISVNEMFTELNNLRRWTEIINQSKYNELSKQALNCLISFMLAKQAEHEGKSIRFESFPRIAIGRASAKVSVYFDTPEHKIHEICQLSQIPKTQFDDVANEINAERISVEFSKFIGEGLGEYEVRIYRAATKIATYIELLEQQENKAVLIKYREIERSIEEFEDLPGIKEFSDPESKIFQLLQAISTLRNQNRWATRSYNVECSVLGHLFDTAVWAYLIALDKQQDEEYATKMFFMGIFHDIAEVWTKDIPSPIKDRIPGFRKATEEYERKMLQKHVYSVVPDFMAKALKEVMLEEKENLALKKELKDADYLSADSECYRNLLSGTRDTYFCKAIINHIPRDVSPLYIEIHESFEKYAYQIQNLFCDLGDL